MPLMAKKPAGRPQRAHKGSNLNVWINSEIVEAMERFLESHEPRTDKTSLTELALKRLLTEFGYWPPKPPG